MSIPAPVPPHIMESVEQIIAIEDVTDFEKLLSGILPLVPVEDYHKLLSEAGCVARWLKNNAYKQEEVKTWPEVKISK